MRSGASRAVSFTLFPPGSEKSLDCVPPVSVIIYLFLFIYLFFNYVRIHLDDWGWTKTARTKIEKTVNVSPFNVVTRILQSNEFPVIMVEAVNVYIVFSSVFPHVNIVIDINKLRLLLSPDVCRHESYT